LKSPRIRLAWNQLISRAESLTALYQLGMRVTIWCPLLFNLVGGWRTYLTGKKAVTLFTIHSSPSLDFEGRNRATTKSKPFQSLHTTIQPRTYHHHASKYFLVRFLNRQDCAYHDTLLQRVLLLLRSFWVLLVRGHVNINWELSDRYEKEDTTKQWLGETTFTTSVK